MPDKDLEELLVRLTGIGSYDLPGMERFQGSLSGISKISPRSKNEQIIPSDQKKDQSEKEK